jgi:hypothetical protein
MVNSEWAVFLGKVHVTSLPVAHHSIFAHSTFTIMHLFSSLVGVSPTGNRIILSPADSADLA